MNSSIFADEFIDFADEFIDFADEFIDFCSAKFDEFIKL
jgi:hypothetical protein